MKHLLILVLLSGSLASCGTKELKGNQEGTIKVTEITKALMTIWETGDTSKTKDIFDPNCEYVDVANNYIYSGISGVNEYIGHIHGWASEVKMTVRKINTSEKMGYVEWTLTARQTSPIEGKVLVATNNEITLKGVTLIELKEGKIKKASDYMDVLGFVMQLGSKLELPGGVIIGQ